jgi:soluble lytic murein transglycosylase-like protein
MIDIYKRKTFTESQMQCLLLLLILQCMFVFQFNMFNSSFLQNKAKTAEVPVILQEEPEPAAIEEEKEDVFAYQIKKAEPLYNPIILEAANLNDVDITMVKAIIMAESSYNRRSVSRYGARGLMQLMPATAKSLGVKDVFNPHENIHAGVRYYKSLLKRFDGDEKLALAAYNAGATNVRRYKGVPPFKETRRYIKKVLSYQQFYRHGPDFKKSTSI